MSLSSNEESKNPAKKFLSWKGGVGVWQYYDKEAKENVKIEDPMYIVPLDELSTIKGWHDASQSGIYSNEWKDFNEDEVSVRSFKGGEIVKGKYADIKGKLEGGKFCKSVYAALLNSKGEVIELVNFSFSGSSLGSWIEAKVDIKAGNILILSKNPEQQKKGATTYYVPKIVIKPKNEKIISECMSMDKELQDYLSSRKENQTKTVTQGGANTPNEGFDEQPKAAVAQEEEDNSLPF